MGDNDGATHPLSCQCGTVRGFISAPARANRGLCYCADCQAYARFLKGSNSILDAAGGSQIVATQPRYLQFTHGFDAVACMSLSDKGLLRWYASCCKTPIGNTPRDVRVAYVGLLHNCLTTSPQHLQQVFGPVRVVLNTQSATAPVPSTPIRNFFAILRLVKTLSLARLTKSYTTNPFFTVAGEPVKPVRVLSASEREQLEPAA